VAAVTPCAKQYWAAYWFRKNQYCVAVATPRAVERRSIQSASADDRYYREIKIFAVAAERSLIWIANWLIVKVRAVGYHMAVSQWGYPRQISIINLLTRCAQLANDIADLDRVPHQDCVRLADSDSSPYS
jgi:hypothetical protein